jgi:predicted small integral membrane protein
MGTPAYMSPEQCQGVELDGRTDIYSLGVVLYEVTTGYLPFHTSSLTDAVFKHVYTEPPSPLTVKADLPVALEAIILRCLRKAPPERFQRAWELIDALEQFLAKRAPAPVAVAPPPDQSTATVYVAPAPVVAPPVVPETARPAASPEDGPFELKAPKGDRAGTLRRLLLPLLTVAAGLLVMLGSVGPWIHWGEGDEVAGPDISEYFSGEQVYDDLPSDGSATLLLGAIVALAGAVKAFVPGRSIRVTLSIVALVALVVVILIGGYSWGYLADVDYPRGWGLELVLLAAILGILPTIIGMRRLSKREA